jgi:serine carboxypeptidase-like clade I
MGRMNRSLLVVVAWCFGWCAALPNARDRIVSLPFLDLPFPSPQYSGYLNATKGCGSDVLHSSNSSNGGPIICQIHYWFIAAEEHGRNNNGDDSPTQQQQQPYTMDPNTPLLVWFNGGPGASSIIGLLHEFGPFLITHPTTTATNTTTTTTTTRPSTTAPHPHVNDHHPTTITTTDPPANFRFVLNPYRWTRLAHILILESPVGVGYSYCSNTVHPTATSTYCTNTDRTTATMALAALMDFYSPHPDDDDDEETKVWAQLPTTDLYIVGESYAGVYVPTLAYEILQYNRKIQEQEEERQQQQTYRPGNSSDPDTTNFHHSTTNTQKKKTKIPLVGMAVGDPCTDTVAQSPYMNPLWYGHQYGLVDDDIYTKLTSASCQSIAADVRDTNHNSHREEPETDHHHTQSSDDTAAVDPECRLAYRKYLFSSSRGISATNKYPYTGYIDRYALYGLVSNQLNQITERYMNHPQVRTALHIPNFLFNTTTTTTADHDDHDTTTYWKIHSTPATMKYIKEYNACNHDAQYDASIPSMIDLYQNIIPHLKYGTWIYNGNADPAIPYEGTRTAVKRIGYAEMDGGSYRPWFYHPHATSMQFLHDKWIQYGTESLFSTVQDIGIQLGGMVINYENGLSFLTVHGSGHMVPQMRPQSAYHIVSKFISCSTCSHHRHPTSSRTCHSECGVHYHRTTRRSRTTTTSQHHPVLSFLSPLLPTNATLLNLKNDTDQLNRVLDEWTTRAKSPPYVQSG